MRNKTAYILLSLACMGISLQASAQKFAIKPQVNVGVGSAMSLKSDLPLSSKKASSTAFGVDFGYTFWNKGGHALEANIGLGYTVSGVKLGVDGLNFSYNAPASADEDGNAYIRHYNVAALEQKFNLGYLNIPLYLTYGYQFSQRIAVHADLGFRLGFKCNAKINSVIGTAGSYGVYPEYDDLMIDAPWLNQFGETDLADAGRGEVEANGFYASLLVGAALDVYIAGPVWFNLGLRYDCGFTDSFSKMYESKNFNSATAPVTYTVAGGQEVKPLTSYLDSSKLSPFSILLGLTFKF